ncbi:hypothetical protein PC129_g24157, partial [Phytophthora cactorum]
MLPDSAAGATATAAARAPAAPAGPHDLATPSSDAAAPPRPDKVQEALAPPGRAGGMLPDLSSVGPAPMQADATSSRDSRSSKHDEAPVPATYAHDAAQFACVLCQYVAESMAVLVSHRRSAHRGTRFQDTFTSG